MIDIIPALGIILFVMFLTILTAFGGMFLGAWIHHRGVSIGSGRNETFTGKVPDGEVFRLPEVDDLPNEPEDAPGNPADIGKANRFLKSMLRGVEE